MTVDDPVEPPEETPERPRRHVAVVGVVVAVGLVIGLLGWQLASREQGQAVPRQIAEGERPEAPDFELPRLDADGSLRLSSLRGQPVVLNFWASWCAPCRDEAPALQAAYERYRDQGLVIVGVNVEDFSGDARAFMARYGLTFQMVRDGEGGLPGRYGIRALPETFFVGRDGHIVAHVAGPVEAEGLAQGIEAALG